MFQYWFIAGSAMALGWCLTCLVVEESAYRIWMYRTYGVWRWKRRNKHTTSG